MSLCYNIKMDNLFTAAAKTRAPLADRMRPATLDDFVGQSHIIGEGMVLRRAVLADKLGSCIFYGPPGCGKTTLAHIIAANTNSAFEKLNAVSSGVADAKRVIDEARKRLEISGKRTYLLLDECHRWNKAQSDCVLSAIEEGVIVFIGSTTENPNVSMTKAIVSRCRVFEFKPLTTAEISAFLYKAVKNTDRGLGRMSINLLPDAADLIAFTSGGDMRSALNALELAALTTPPDKTGVIVIDKGTAAESMQKKALSVDESLYYDILSAFCKSLRGSDENAALYWASRLIEAGVDPMLIARRLIAHASEDVGMADSNASIMAVNAMLALERTGLPEGRLPLFHAIIYVCRAPKSNAVVNALGAAVSDAREDSGDNVPHHLRDRSYGHPIDDGSVYKYPHDYGGTVQQQYLPDSRKNRKYYVPSKNGREKDF